MSNDKLCHMCPVSTTLPEKRNGDVFPSWLRTDDLQDHLDSRRGRDRTPGRAATLHVRKEPQGAEHKDTCTLAQSFLCVFF